MLSLLPVEGTTRPIVLASGSVLVILCSGRCQSSSMVSESSSDDQAREQKPSFRWFYFGEHSTILRHHLWSRRFIAARYHFVYFPAVG